MTVMIMEVTKIKKTTQPKSSLTPPLQLFWPHLRRRPDNYDEGHHHLHNWISTSQPWQDVCDFSFKALRLHSVCFGIRDSCLWSLRGGITDLRICPRCHKSAEVPRKSNCLCSTNPVLSLRGNPTVRAAHCVLGARWQQLQCAHNHNFSQLE